MTRRAQGLAISLGVHALACWALWRVLTPPPPTSATLELTVSPPAAAASVLSGMNEPRGGVQDSGPSPRAVLTHPPPLREEGGAGERSAGPPLLLPVAGLARIVPPPASPSAVSASPSSTPVPLPAVRPANQETPGLAASEVPAKLLRQAAPRYPRRARAARREGAVTVGFEVDATGAVRHPQATGEAAEVAWFGAAACDAVAAWTFTPALRAGRPVTCQVQVLVRFSLDR
jgi:periplasmic protein TonB